MKDFSVPNKKVVLTEKYPKIDRTGKTLVTKDLQKAIDELASKGGGQLVIPEGTYLISPIVLKSNIDLHLEKGSLLLATTDKTAWNPSADKKPHPLISAENAKNIIISGSGTIDGNGKYWWPQKYSRLTNVLSAKNAETYWKGLEAMGGVVTGEGKNRVWFPFNLKEQNAKSIGKDYKEQEKLRSNYLFTARKCTNVKLTGVTFKNSQKMHIEPYDCTNVIFDGIKVDTPPFTPNTDALDIATCNRVLIVHCEVTCGDDGIVTKAGGPSSKYGYPLQNFLVRYNIMRHSHCGFGVGSLNVDGLEKTVVIDNAFFNSTMGGFEIKTPAGRAGTVKDLYFYDNVIKDAKFGIRVFFEYEDKGVVFSATAGDDKTKFLPDVHDVHFKNILVTNTSEVVSLAALKGQKIHRFDFEDCAFEGGNMLTLAYTHDSSFKNCAFVASGSEFLASNSSGLTFDGCTMNGVRVSNIIVSE